VDVFIQIHENRPLPPVLTLEKYTRKARCPPRHPTIGKYLRHRGIQAGHHDVGNCAPGPACGITGYGMRLRAERGDFYAPWGDASDAVRVETEYSPTARAASNSTKAVAGVEFVLARRRWGNAGRRPFNSGVNRECQSGMTAFPPASAD